LKKADTKLLLSNFTNFGIFQIFNYIVPLITIPYIVRVVGPEKFGIISLAYAICYYFNIITDYGYSISGVQKIAQNQTDSDKRSEITKNIFTVQTLVMIVCIILLIGIINLFSELKEYEHVFYFSFLMVPANVFIALWFYLGIERVYYINYVTLCSKIVYVAFILIFIQTEADFYLVPLIYSLSLLIGGLVSLIILIKIFQITFKKHIPLHIRKYLIEDRSLFVSNVFINLYRNTNIIILNFFVGTEVVGIYSAGERIIKAIQGVFTPLTQVLYPYISRIRIQSEQRSKSVIKIMMIWMGILSFLVSIVLFWGAALLTDIFLGESFQATEPILRITSFVIFIGMLNYILGIIYMTNFGMKATFSRSVIITGLLNIIICAILSFYFQAIGAAITFMLAEIILFIILIIYIKKNKKPVLQNES
jgi:PST family polysaccharide transporter